MDEWSTLYYTVKSLVVFKNALNNEKNKGINMYECFTMGQTLFYVFLYITIFNPHNLRKYMCIYTYLYNYSFFSV